MRRSRTTSRNHLSGLSGSATRRLGSTTPVDERRETTEAARSRSDRAVCVPFSVGRALTISSDPVDQLLVDERLSTSGEFDVDIAPHLETALELARIRQFDAIVLDPLRADGASAPTLRQLFETAPEAAVVVIGDASSRVNELDAIDAGAHEYVRNEQLGDDALIHAVRRAVGRNRRRVELDRLANVDTLTGLLNRRGFDELGVRALDAAERLGSMFTVLYLDIDGLDQINHGYGHSAGDDALRETAHAIAETVRTTDLVARIGGDEFCVALTDGSPPPEDVARRLGRNLDERNARREGWLLSIALGASHFDEWAAPELWNLVEEAATRMLAAKPSGLEQRITPVDLA